MKSSIVIGRFAGIPLKIHWSFALIFFYIFYIAVDSELDLAGIGFITLLILSVFFCVILHEYGHALMAKRYDVRTSDILVTPIGGIARLERMPEKPLQEVWIAIAGPAVNVVIALVLGVALFFFDIPQNIELEYLSVMPFREMVLLFGLTLLLMNLILVGFNMIPAFPMDGGRVLRALLSLKFSRVRATQVASYLGQLISVVFVVIGIWKKNYSLTFIGFFIFAAARSEYSALLLEQKLNRLTARDIMNKGFRSFSFREPMKAVIESYNTQNAKYFVVVDDDNRYIGMLSERQISLARDKKDILSPVSDYFTPYTSYLSPEINIQAIIKRFRAEQLYLLPVIQYESIVGIIDRDAIQTALNSKHT